MNADTTVKPEPRLWRVLARYVGATIVTRAEPDPPAAEPSCRTCRFWPARVETYGIYGNGGHHCDGSVSDCRRHAPSAVDARPGAALSGGGLWPTTGRHDWCGDWERRADV